LDQAKKKEKVQKHKEQIEKIMSEMKCSKNFRCYESGFKILGKAEDIHIESFVKCLEAKAWECEFAFAFGSEYFCKCPLRIYILKNLGK